MMQTLFDFTNEPALPILNRDEQKETILEFLRSNKVDQLFVIDKIKLRSRQFVLMEEACRRWGQNILIEGGTGIGKTLLYFTLAAKCIVEGKIPILVTFEGKSVTQAVKKAQAQMRLVDQQGKQNNSLTLGLTSSIPVETRETLLRTINPFQIVTTSGVMITDFEHYDWSKIGLIMFDETQNMVGNSSMMKLARMIEEKLRTSENRPMICGMSATLAATETELNAIQRVLKIQKIITVRNPNDLRDKVEDQVNTVPVDLDMTTRRILHHLSLRISCITHEIKTALGGSVLFISPKDQDFWVPSFRERQLLWKGLYKPNFRHSKLGILRSDLSQLEYYSELHSRILSLGHFALFEKYCYQRLQWLCSHEDFNLDLPEMTSPTKVKKNQATQDGVQAMEPSSTEALTPKKKVLLGPGVRKALKDEKLLELIIVAAKDTPYSTILEHDNWQDIRSSMLAQKFNETTDEFSINAKRRLEKTQTRNKYLLFSANRKNSKLTVEEAENTALVRCFFDYSMGFMAQRELNDHQKESELLDQLTQVRDRINHVSSFIFTSLTRHAEFLAERIERTTCSTEIRPVAAHGRLGAGMKLWRQSAFDCFNNKKHNLLVTTVAFAGTGIDVENATIGIHYALANSNHVLLVQANGRVLGRADDPLLYLLWSKGAMNIEMKRFFAAVKKEIKRRRMILRRAFVVEEKFEVENPALGR